jgi:hypothetical protein
VCDVDRIGLGTGLTADYGGDSERAPELATKKFLAL